MCARQLCVMRYANEGRCGCAASSWTRLRSGWTALGNSSEVHERCLAASQKLREIVDALETSTECVAI